MDEHHDDRDRSTRRCAILTRLRSLRTIASSPSPSSSHSRIIRCRPYVTPLWRIHSCSSNFVHPMATEGRTLATTMQRLLISTNQIRGRARALHGILRFTRMTNHDDLHRHHRPCNITLHVLMTSMSKKADVTERTHSFRCDGLRARMSLAEPVRHPSIADWRENRCEIDT